MKNKVVKIEVKASVAGRELAAQEATISLGVNAIPSIELNCAPIPSKGNIGPLNAYVLKPTLSQYAEMYQDLSEKAEKLSEPGNISIKLSGDMTDSLSLNGWILSGAGLSGVGATEAPYLSVIFQHPICQLTKVGSTYETPKKDLSMSLDAATEAGTDFLDIISKAYDFIRKVGDSAFWPCPPGYNQPKMFRQKLGVSPFDPREYLVWKSGPKGSTDLFLAGGDAGAKKCVARSIGRMAFSGSGGSSTWDLISGSAGSLLLSVTQDDSNNFTTKKLVLEPAQPWKADWIYIDQEVCNSIDLPGMDPFRIIGVMSTKLGAYAGPINTGLLKNGNQLKKDPVTDILYVPVKDATDADGRIMKTAAPSILDSAFRRDAVKGKNITTGMVEMSTLKMEGYNGAVGKYCKAVYEMSAASMKQANVTTALMFNAGGKKILPGRRCCIQAEGKDLYNGYIRSVVHRLSVNGGNSTHIAMSYLSPKAGFHVGEQVVIPNGAPNPAYT